jgi:cellulose 1,4-beta-cellobiosidase
MRQVVCLSLIIAVAMAATTVNPFLNQRFYLNPDYQAQVDSSLATTRDQTTRAGLLKLKETSSAYWIDVKRKIPNAAEVLEDAASKNELIVLIIYDLPNRDCHALASNGEICCTYNADRTCNYLAIGDCADGLNEYKTQYIDPLIQVLSQYQDRVPIVTIIEPDSLPNLATNLGNAKCGNTATQNAYIQGISYTLEQLATKVPKVTVYLDGAHGGWLGWAEQMTKFVDIVRQVNPAGKIRGFSTNVANYQELGVPCQDPNLCITDQSRRSSDPCCNDPCRLLNEYNAANNELNYVQLMAKAFSFLNPHFVIDTSRNGGKQNRQKCANWCNVRNAGIGQVPTTATALPNLVDAYFWLKPPGESDGCSEILPSGGRCPRFDAMCASVDSIGSQSGEPRVPEAGGWFDYQAKMLARGGSIAPSEDLAPNPAPMPTTPSPSSSPTTRRPSPITLPPSSRQTPSPATRSPTLMPSSPDAPSDSDSISFVSLPPSLPSTGRINIQISYTVTDSDSKVIVCSINQEESGTTFAVNARRIPSGSTAGTLNLSLRPRNANGSHRFECGLLFVSKYLESPEDFFNNAIYKATSPTIEVQ